MPRSLIDPPAEVRQAEDLATLAAEINAEHAAAEGAVRSSLEHARAAGEKLIRAKAACGHGGFLDWLGKNVKFKERCARNYMAICRDWEKIKSAGSADLSIDSALRLLSPDNRDSEIITSNMLSKYGCQETEQIQPDPTDEVDKPEFPCPTCGEVFDREKWHCQGCNGHFAKNVHVCPKCPGRADETPASTPAQQANQQFDVMQVVFKVRNFVDKIIPSSKGLKEEDKAVLRQLFRQLANEV